MSTGTRRSLREICGPFPDLDLVGDADGQVGAVVADSRRAAADAIFVAVVGTETDGHDFLEAVLATGCRLLLVQRDRLEGVHRTLRTAAAEDVVLVTAADTRRYPALLARELAGRPDAELVIAGVTGTNGKTTTCFLLQTMLARLVGRCGLLGTVRYDDGRESRAASLTTPAGPDLYPWLQELVAGGGRAVAMEVSSHALQQERVAGLALDVAVLTNLSRDHLDYHGGMAEYLAAKVRIIDHVRAGDARGKAPGALAVNIGDPHFATLDTGGVPTVRYLARHEAVRETAGGGAVKAPDVAVHAVELSPRGSRLELRVAGGALSLKTPLVGRFNVENVVAALAAGYALGLDPEACAAALETTEGVPGRLERFSLPRGGTAVVDYAHTPDALAALLETCRELTAGQLLLVFGCGGDRDRGKRPVMGEVAAAAADRIWITSDNPRGEDPQAIVDAIVAGIIAAPGAAPHETILDRRAAIETALRSVSGDDIVVIAGKGHEDHQIIGDRRLHLDDREIVRDWITSEGESRG